MGETYLWSNGDTYFTFIVDKVDDVRITLRWTDSVKGVSNRKWTGEIEEWDWCELIEGKTRALTKLEKALK